jgi:hypothetical protein
MADARRLHVVVPTRSRPVAPAPGWGQCVSCGTPIPEGRWRLCPVPQALEQVLGLPPVAETPP